MLNIWGFWVFICRFGFVFSGFVNVLEKKVYMYLYIYVSLHTLVFDFP